MKKICKSLSSLVFLSIPFISLSAHAITYEWKGRYQFEFTDIDNVNLTSNAQKKSYLLHSLVFGPEIIAADGINISTQFNLTPNAQYPGSLVGSQLGGKTYNRSTSGASTGQDSNVAGTQAPSYSLELHKLLLTVDQEYGQLLFGRTPTHFGLGMSHDDGRGMFSHWDETKDLLGYKFIIGNLTFMPAVGKKYDPSPAMGNEVTEVIYDIQYNNPDTDSLFGIYSQVTNAGLASNDAVASSYSGATKQLGWSSQLINVTLSRGFSEWKFDLEAGFQSGTTGIFTAQNEEIKLSGFGVATELKYNPNDSKWKMNLRMGMATGDNPETANYESFHFSRNYDVAMLLFNHPLGIADLLRSDAQRNTDTCTTAPCSIHTRENSLDEETVSNAVYFSPRFDYALSEKKDLRFTFTAAQILVSPKAGIQVEKDLGYELDIAYVYKHTDKIQWVNELGALSPGKAWKFDGTGGNNFTYGFSSRAAISF